MKDTTTKLVSFVFYIFVWHKRSFIGDLATSYFTVSKFLMTFKVSKMHPFVKIYGIIPKKAYFLKEN